MYNQRVDNPSEVSYMIPFGVNSVMTCSTPAGTFHDTSETTSIAINVMWTEIWRAFGPLIILNYTDVCKELWPSVIRCMNSMI